MTEKDGTVGGNSSNQQFVNIFSNNGMKKVLFFMALIAIGMFMYLYGALVSIKEGHVGVVFAKFGKTSEVPNRFIVEKGEQGQWREVLLPGWHFFWSAGRLWNYNIKQEPMTLIRAQHVGVVEALDGTPMEKGRILAKDDYIDSNGVFHMGNKGPRLNVLKPGFHPINPRYFKITEVKAIAIPQNKIGVVTRKIGKEPPAGTVLVSKDSGYKGLQKETLPPGTYYINPLEQNVQLVDVKNVQDGYVGIKVAKTGNAIADNRELAREGERGIQEKPIEPGMYYINPNEFEVIIFDTREQRYEMTSQSDKGDTIGDDSIHFLSDDGFDISFDLTVIYQVRAEHAPYIIKTIGRDINTVRDKKVRPAARSFARIMGSKYRGEEFIHGVAREKFQKELHDALKKRCAESDIIIHQTLVRHFEVPQNLRKPIIQKVIALKLEQQYKQEQETEKANANLARQKQMIVFESEKVKAETIKVRAIISAEQQRDEEEIMMVKKKFEAEGEAAKMKIHADALLYEAQKEAEGIKAKRLAEAEGQKALVDAWSGEGARNMVASKLAEIMDGASILPLDMFFGGRGGTDSKGSGPIQYHNTIDLLNFFNLNKLVKKQNKPGSAEGTSSQ
ncbi:SPFH domain-containing protein [Desulfobacterales bacterium HSG16]|nr:SPFH domain-containing protein [Desulfobacterales bacterium HSG16]